MMESKMVVEKVAHIKVGREGSDWAVEVEHNGKFIEFKHPDLEEALTMMGTYITSEVDE